jgi:DNA-binding response OmpR family regulator
VSEANISILIAEDDIRLRQLYVEYLALFFNTVYEAKDGLEALQIYKEKSPDIIISDINMPKLDGLQLIEKIRQKDMQTQVVILSAYADQETLLQAIKLNLFEYLVKPVESQQLKDLIMSMIRKIQHAKNHLCMPDGYKWHKEHRQLFKNDLEIILQEGEKRLLEILIRYINTNVSNETLYQYIFSDEPQKEYSSHAITSLVKRVRKKLPDNIIRTNYGNGYTFSIKKY